MLSRRLDLRGLDGFEVVLDDAAPRHASGKWIDQVKPASWGTLEPVGVGA